MKNDCIYQKVIEKRNEKQPAIREAILECAHIDSGELCFTSSKSLDRALTDGIFILKIPAEINLGAGDAFSRQFYLGDETAYGRFRNVTGDIFGDPLLGFHQRVNQIEQFLLERRLWRAHYPSEIALLGECLNLLSQIILRHILKEVKIPECDWCAATGGCSDIMGSYHLTFNHYRPAIDSCGLNSHKDDGFLTILRSYTPGLEVNRNRDWEWVSCDEEHFVINFGLAMEILTEHCQRPVAAIMHRVRRQKNHRTSFGHFTSSGCIPGMDQGVYRYIPSLGLEWVCGSRQLIDSNDAEIYEGTMYSEE